MSWPWLRAPRTWTRSVEPVLLVSLLIVVAAVWGFAELADEVMEGQTQTFDERLLVALRQPGDLAQPRGPWWLPEAARDITALGGVAVLALATTGVAGFLALSRRPGMLIFVLIAIGGGTALSSLLKTAFPRERPSVVPHLAVVSTPSFPSGHSLMSAVVYLTLGALLTTTVGPRRLKIYLLAVAVVLSGLVGLTRVYIGVHYPTDVLAGWMTGLAWAALCWTVAHWLQRRGTVEPEPRPDGPA
ncbi:MAG: phosphatase PAP2 family protein [Planctomycetota bacterium]